jgi:MYXO-CTERM domain-containing protein
MKELMWMCVGMLTAMTAQAGTITLGTFTFNDQEFGNTLSQSDGGTFLSNNWLNVVDSDPGSPGALTGANFNTGIANIGIDGATVEYTIGYDTPIVNGPGADFGLVVGYSWQTDVYHVAVSANGTTFTPFQNFSGGSLGVDTGVNMSYWYAGEGQYATDLIVVPIDLSQFGIASGASVDAIEIEGLAGEQPDYFRIAGFGTGTTVSPEPVSMLLAGAGLAGLAFWRRRVKARTPSV